MQAYILTLVVWVFSLYAFCHSPPFSHRSSTPESTQSRVRGRDIQIIPQFSRPVLSLRGGLPDEDSELYSALKGSESDIDIGKGHKSAQGQGMTGSDDKELEFVSTDEAESAVCAAP